VLVGRLLQRNTGAASRAARAARRHSTEQHGCQGINTHRPQFTVCQSSPVSDHSYESATLPFLYYAAERTGRPSPAIAARSASARSATPRVHGGAGSVCSTLPAAVRQGVLVGRLLQRNTGAASRAARAARRRSIEQPGCQRVSGRFPAKNGRVIATVASADPRQQGKW